MKGASAEEEKEKANNRQERRAVARIHSGMGKQTGG